MEIPTKVKNIAAEILYRSAIARKIYVQLRFPEEIKFSLSENQSSKEGNKSVLFFTTHKCASMYIGKTLKTILRNNQNLTFIDLNGYRSAKGATISAEGTYVGAPEDISDTELNRRIYFQPSGYFFGPLRHPGYLDLVKNIDDYKILLILRDPRNMLISLYSTIRYNHLLPFASAKDRERMLVDRKKASEQTVDQFVLEHSTFWLRRYKLYCEKLIGRENVLFIKFEDLVSGMENNLNNIVSFLKLNPDPKKVTNIINQSKKKQIIPSDYRRKLKPETIQSLNQEFSQVLRILGYN